MPLDLQGIGGAAYDAFPAQAVNDAVRDWIDYRIVGEPELVTRSRESYVAHHLARSLAAIQLLPQRPDRGRLLELGSGIYLMTFLVERLRNYDLELVQYWGRPSGRYASRLVHARSGEQRVLNFAEFNAESERFPYADSSFDAILNCDTIEHALADPVHMLTECHRILKPGGLMILTTPNVVRLDNVVRLLRGMNILDKYVLESPSARHPREYTSGELRRLLEWVGFDVPKLDTIDVTRTTLPWWTRKLARGCLAAFAVGGRLFGRDGDGPLNWRGEQIIALAVRNRPVNTVLPDFLFEMPGMGGVLIAALHGDSACR